MKKQVGRYSKYLRPATILLDLGLLHLWISFLLPIDLSTWLFRLFVTAIWLILTPYTKFYEVYRYTKIIQIASKTVKQFVLFTVFCFAFIGFLSKDISSKNLLLFIGFSLICITSLKFAVFLSLKVFRRYFNGNLRKVVIIGKDKQAHLLASFFKEEKDYGYDLLQQFSLNELPDFEVFCTQYKIDEIYLTLEKVDSDQINKMILFCDNKFIKLKYIASKKEIIANPSKIEHYGYISIIPEHKTPLELYPNQVVKRSFDIVFSLFIILFIFSWLFPLVALLIKLESKGPVFFRQKRNGLYFEEFDCYKFRSMVVNEQADTHQALKNDKRITRIGRFLRKTSIDEMPQFFNVLMGDMSVCGPRPHMLNFTNQYATDISRYKVRHFVKPGITGMAQTHGYRGEIESKRDIINRIKYDLFYIQNWSLLLDLKIIFLTIKNAVLGDKKAY